MSEGLQSRVSPAARWSLLVAVAGGLFVLIGVSSVRETYREWKVDQEIDRMKAEIERLEGKKVNLTELIETVQSPEVADRDARQRLGLRKPGERVIVVRGIEGAPVPDVVEQSTSSAPLLPASNPARWVRYFFHP